MPLGLLYTNYAPRMKRLCLRYVGDEATAEDILHDGFIIMSRIRQLKDSSKLDNWMAAIMRNLAIRHLGKRGKTVLIPIEEVEDSEDFSCDTMEIVSEYRELLRLVDSLPQGYRSVFKLSVFDGMSHKEIAELLGINPHSSSSQLARAKEMLRTIVTNYGFVLVLIIALLYAVRLNELEYIQRKAATKDVAAERKEPTTHIDKTVRSVVSKQEAAAETVPLSPATDADIDTTTTIQKTDSTEEERKIVLPNINGGGYIADDLMPSRTHNFTTANWQTSVSYSGGTAANSSVFTTIPNMGSDIGGEETVETKTRHYMPFVVSLSLQKSLGNNWSVGTGLRYTRLKTDITTIGEYETTSETQKVEYIGIPLSLNYNL